MKTPSVLVCFAFALLQAPSLVFGAAAKVSDYDAVIACKTELNLDDSLLNSFDSIKYYDQSNSNYNDFLSCTWKKLQIQGNDGKINFLELIRYLTEFCEKRAAEVFSVVPDQTVVEGWLESCRGIQEDTHGKTAAKVHFCLARGIDEFRQAHRKH